MKPRVIALPLIAMSLLSSCSVELRSDIKEFVASFSLSEAMATYKVAGYTSVKETKKDGVKTLENITLNFNVSDPENPEYHLTTSTKIDENEAQIVEKFSQKIENKFYLYETGKDPVEYTADQIKLLVRDFFYTKTMYDGDYHSNGMYYGDFVLETARDLQGFVEIDGENELYIFRHYTEGKVDGLDSSVEQMYSVNKLGMLVKNISNQVKGDDYIKQEINVFKS